MGKIEEKDELFKKKNTNSEDSEEFDDDLDDEEFEESYIKEDNSWMTDDEREADERDEQREKRRHRARLTSFFHYLKIALILYVFAMVLYAGITIGLSDRISLSNLFHKTDSTEISAGTEIEYEPEAQDSESEKAQAVSEETEKAAEKVTETAETTSESSEASGQASSVTGSDNTNADADSVQNDYTYLKAGTKIVIVDGRYLRSQPSLDSEPLISEVIAGGSEFTVTQDTHVEESTWIPVTYIGRSTGNEYNGYLGMMVDNYEIIETE